MLMKQFLDLRETNVDPEVYAAALAVEHINKLITYGGSEYSRPELASALHPQHLELFLVKAVGKAQQTGRFEQEWQMLQRLLPQVKLAWEKGQVCFSEHLSRAIRNQEEMEYLSQIDFAVDCYAPASALRVYPDGPALQAWLINGYMTAWMRHFLTRYGDAETHRG